MAKAGAQTLLIFSADGLTRMATAVGWRILDGDNSLVTVGWR
jgi:hypothetical protein